MRRHAKAATAGLTQRQATGLGRLVRAGATARGGSSSPKGSSAPAAGLFASLLALALTAMALLAAPASAAAPAISDTWVEGVAFAEATLKAEINPEGVATNFHFKYGTTVAYGSETAAAAVGSDSAKHNVGAAVGGLQPGTTYHYRVIATSSGGTSEGPDHTFTTYTHPVQDTECPNQVFRTGASAALPDCRAYELVSAPNKEGALIKEVSGVETFLPRVAAGGGVAAFPAFGTFKEAGPTGNAITDAFLARRGPNGWRNEQLDPPFDSGFEVNYDGVQAFTPDLGAMLTFAPEHSPIVPESSRGSANLVYRDNSTGAFHQVSVNLPANKGSSATGLEYQGVAADGSHVLFRSQKYQLNGEAGTAPYLYDWSAATGELTLIPGGHEVADQTSFARHDPLHVVSDDGSRIFFHGGFGGFSGIFVRIDGTTTQRVTESELAPGSGDGEFVFANAAGTVAYVKGAAGGGKLTTDATGISDLYRYEVGGEQLTDITLDPAEEGTGGAQVRAIFGAADDGSRVYFDAAGVLATGATAGEENLYVWSDDGTPKGKIDYITTGVGGLLSQWLMNSNYRDVAARVSPSGRYLTFQESTRSLTGYPNRGATEIYVYDAAAEKLSCASCNPSGAPASTGATSQSPAGISAPTHTPRNVTDSGHVFFSTEEALVPWDVNGRFDAYEYNSATGKVSLISTGTSGIESHFAEISADGTDALFTTSERLVGIDTDAANDVYDARVGGGIAAQNPTAPPIPCVAETCQNIPVPPNDATPASASFRGAGNPEAKKARRGCRARHRHAGKGKRKASHKRAKACRRANRGAGK